MQQLFELWTSNSFLCGYLFSYVSTGLFLMVMFFSVAEVNYKTRGGKLLIAVVVCLFLAMWPVALYYGCKSSKNEKQ